MESIQIETTQNVTLEYTPASVGDRILAYLIDSLIIIAWLIMFIFIGVGLGINSRSNGAPFVVLFVIGFLPLMFYNLVSELLMNGQTVGKKAMSIRERMITEVNKSVEIAYALCALLDKYDIALEVHADINTDPYFQSNVALREAMGYILSMGFVFRAKPDSFASSSCANKVV